MPGHCLGGVVGFLNPPRRTCGASSLPPRYPLKAKWYDTRIPTAYPHDDYPRDDSGRNGNYGDGLFNDFNPFNKSDSILMVSGEDKLMFSMRECFIFSASAKGMGKL